MAMRRVGGAGVVGHSTSVAASFAPSSGGSSRANATRERDGRADCVEARIDGRIGHGDAHGDRRRPAEHTSDHHGLGE